MRDPTRSVAVFAAHKTFLRTSMGQLAESSLGGCHMVSKLIWLWSVRVGCYTFYGKINSSSLGVCPNGRLVGSSLENVTRVKKRRHHFMGKFLGLLSTQVKSANTVRHRVNFGMRKGEIIWVKFKKKVAKGNWSFLESLGKFPKHFCTNCN
jgi:hypothetical protein